MGGSTAFGRLEGKVAMVVGASRGIGAAAVRRLAADGAAVVLVGRTTELMESVAAEVTGAGGRALVITGDASSPSDMRDAVARTVEAFGGLDIACNNAGVQAPPKRLHELDFADFAWVMDVNVNGVFHAMQAEIPAMLERGGGSIINTSSIGGIRGSAGIAPYIASKHAVVGLSRTAALDYAEAGIRVNVLAPGATETEMYGEYAGAGRETRVMRIPMRRVSDPAEQAAVIAFLASDDASFVTGAVIVADGGRTVP